MVREREERRRCLVISKQPRSAELSATEMTEYVLPQHANVFGNVFGGQIMAWVDLCAAICAQRHSGLPCVTASVDDLLFQKPVKVGEVVRLRARITATFRTSIEIEVIVTGENTQTGAEWPCVQCWTTCVAVDSSGRPTPVPPLLLETENERSVQEAAEERRRKRLAKR
jgi:acyl-CoA hydrolase